MAKTKKPASEINRDIDKIPYRVKQTIEEYANNGFNATQAYKATHPNASMATSAVNGCKTLNRTNNRAYLDHYLEQHNLGVSVRIQSLSQVIRGKYLQRKEIYRVDKETGEEVLSKVEVISPSSRDIVAAVAEVNKVTGEYDKAHENVKRDARLQKELDKLVKDLEKHRIEDRTPK